MCGTVKLSTFDTELHLLKDIILLERVQRRATKYDYSSDYKSRLECTEKFNFFIKSLRFPNNSFNVLDLVLRPTFINFLFPVTLPHAIYSHRIGNYYCN